ncbi:hypothetical protein CRE_09382 [Caenorhabditis remanei]|uniref:Uncharacterized protein n=1 Tax=Caenorhabditis remanei TaxID=31234 RepID=E3LII8_CAERE|nr:hypothetical protein CRE_09382 [Caenorhabditis remanei]
MSQYVPGDTAVIKLPQVAKYRRLVNEGDLTVEYIFRVCNGKNKKICGFWENTKNKTKVTALPTNYNKNKKALVVKNV